MEPQIFSRFGDKFFVVVKGLIWVRWNLLRDFSDPRRPIFKCFDIIRFVFSLAFQRRILNCYTAKTRAATTKTKHEVENRLLFIFWIRYFNNVKRRSFRWSLFPTSSQTMYGSEKIRKRSIYKTITRRKTKLGKYNKKPLKYKQGGKLAKEKKILI